MRSPPEPLKSLYIDLNKRLDEIKFEANDTPYTYYMKFVNLMKELRDPHTLFTPPCFSNFAFILPYAFTVAVNDGTRVVKAIPSHVRNITNYWIEEQKKVDLLNAEITRMSLSGKEEDLKPALKVISDWAESNVALSKFAHARLNRALYNDFHSRTASQYDYPGESLLVEYVKNGTVGKVSLSWYGIATKEMDGLDSLCPLWKDVNATQTSTVSSLSTVHAEATRLMKTHKLSEKTAFRVAALSALEQRESTRFVESIATPFAAPSMRTDEASERWAELNRHAQTEKETKVDAVDPQQLLLVEDTPTLVAYAHPQSSVGYLRISSFAPANLSAFGESVGHALHVFRTQHRLKHLVIDVRSNGGGTVLLGMQLNRFLFPSLFPVYGRYEMRHTDMNNELAKIRDDDGEVIYRMPENNTRYNGTTWYTLTRTKSFTDAQTNTSFSADYTRMFEMEMSDPSVFQHSVDTWLHYPGTAGTALYAPEDVVVLTDGLCGSTCCCFVKHIQETHSARIVGVGYDPYHPNAPFDAGAFCGGTVFSYESVLEIKSDANLSTPIDKTKFPGNFSRQTMNQRWAQHAIHTWTPDDTQSGAELLEFRVNPVDHIADTHYPNQVYDKTPAGMAALISLALPYFEQCAAWEVLPDTHNCPSPDMHNHRIYGHPCTRGVFDAQKCVFARCADGFYLRRNSTEDEGTCVSVDLWQSSTADPAQKKAAVVIIIVLFAAFALFLGISVVVLFFRRRAEHAHAAEIESFENDLRGEQGSVEYHSM